MLAQTTKRDSPTAMRYFVQFVIPACFFLVLVYIVARQKRRQHDGDQPIMTNTTFVLLLIVGSGLTVGLMFGIAAL